MDLTFKQYLVEVTKKKVNVKTDIYNWAMNPTNWSDVKPVNKVAGDSLGKIPTESAQRIWGKRNPKPSDPFVEQPSNKTFTVKINGTQYLINVDKRGDNTYINVKRVEHKSFTGEKEAKISNKNPKEWREIGVNVSRNDVQNVKVYSQDSVWGPGSSIKPDTPFRKIPKENPFVVKINNTRYLIKLGKTPNDRDIKHVSSGIIGILGSTPKRR